MAHVRSICRHIADALPMLIMCNRLNLTFFLCLCFFRTRAYTHWRNVLSFRFFSLNVAFNINIDNANVLLFRFRFSVFFVECFFVVASFVVCKHIPKLAVCRYKRENYKKKITTAAKKVNNMVCVCANCIEICIRDLSMRLDRPLMLRSSLSLSINSQHICTQSMNSCEIMLTICSTCII